MGITKKKNSKRLCNSMKWLLPSYLTFLACPENFPLYYIFKPIFPYQAIAYLGDDFMFQLFGKYRDMALAVKNPCHLNMAACLIKLKQYVEAIAQCSMVCTPIPYVFGQFDELWLSQSFLSRF